MRPRVFPAEDPQREVGCLGIAVASMRPRVFPAEDQVGDVDHLVGASASMRPRVFPAEDVGLCRLSLRGAPRASMRPRVFPAEDSHALVRLVHGHEGFNEAAGIPRGRRVACVVVMQQYYKLQ